MARARGSDLNVALAEAHGELAGMARRLTRDNVSARVAAVCYFRIVDPMRAIIGSSPAALLLRYLQTLVEVGAEPGSTIVLPLPIDTIKPFLESNRDGVGREGLQWSPGS